MHDDELEVTPELARALIADACPEWSALSVEPMEVTGSDNTLYRLGADLLVRLPRQPGGSARIEKEARWLPWIAATLPVAVPEIVFVGEPGLGYPERWSVVRWLTGDIPSDPSTGFDAPMRTGLAEDLAAFVAALRACEVPYEALTDRRLRWYRGEPLVAGDARMHEGIQDCRAINGFPLDLDRVLRVWKHALAVPGAAAVTAPRWYHGDLLAENLLVEDWRLSAVLDFGCLAVGDPTVDLIVGWEVLDAGSRELFRDAFQVDRDEWLRARAWALYLAIMTFPYYWDSMPARCASRLTIAQQVLADAEQTLDLE